MHIIRSNFDESLRLKDESIYTCANGKLGIRGNFEEGYPNNCLSIRGTYINGFAETEDIKYNEKLYGFTDSKQTIVNLPDGQGLELYVSDEKVVCWSDKVKDYSYHLDMENGEVKRSFIYQTNNGDIELSYERFVSFIRPSLFVIRCKVRSIDFNGNIKFISTLNGDVRNFTNSSDPRVASGSGKMLKVNIADHIKDNIQYIQAETLNSKRTINVYSKTILSSNNSLDYDKKDSLLVVSKNLDICANQEIIIDKYCLYSEKEIDNNELLETFNTSFDVLKNEQISYMKNFWDSSRVLIDSNEINQEHLDLCLYVMLCSAGKDGLSSIAAKGLSGEGYEGHYFWDCETYIFPFFLNTNPDIARKLLEYRYNKLDFAKKHARTLGHNSGALYPWRTITGSECSSYYPSGSAQYHINGDIARAFISYWYATNDYSFLPQICEVLLETSRLWIDVGHFDDGLFKIDCVTGPDEYTCLVNNNYYTNCGAKHNLEHTVKLINILKQTNDYNAFVEKTNFTNKELDDFVLASNNMYLPYSEELGIIKQDDCFLDKKKIDLNTIPKENFPMLLHYHPLFLNRHQICKQADAVLADYLYDNVSSSVSKRTLDYYNQVTTHDSSLSKCIFGNVASRLGDLNKAKNQFIETLSTDINDSKGNTKDGLHLANMGGCYDMIVGGFAGLKINENGLYLFPMLPETFNSYKFNIKYLGHIINVFVDKNGTTINTDTNEELNVHIYGREIKINSNSQLVTRKCQGVIFDLDGVITDTAKYHYLAWKKIADELNVEFDIERNEKFKGVSRKTCLELLLEWGNIKLDENTFNETLNRKNEYYKEFLKELTPNDILPGIIDSINYLHSSNIKVSLFSVSKNTDAILARLQIKDIFDEIVSGNDITNSKPHYEGYLLASDRMKLDPRLCTMVEDSESGILGAKALSMKTIAIMKENIANADYVIENTSKLLDVLKLI